MASVVALIPDLLFASRVQRSLAGAGHEVQICAREDEARARGGQADVLILDLSDDSCDAATLVESMLAGRQLGQTRTLGFYPHVDVALRTRGVQAGLDMVVPRSRMARECPDLVEGLLARPARVAE